MKTNMDTNNMMETLERIKKIYTSGGDIYIRGAGNKGQLLFKDLSDLEIKITAFLDENFENLDTVCGVSVLSPKEIYGKQSGSYFVIVAIKTLSVYKKIISEMSENGLILRQDYDDFSLNSELKNPFMRIQALNHKEYLRKFFFLYMERMKSLDKNFQYAYPDNYNNVVADFNVVLTTYCSLKCSQCANCIPLCKKPEHFDIVQAISDLDKFLSVSYSARLSLLGGELFLHPKLAEFLQLYEQLKNKQNIGFTRLVTNGTILPSDDVFKAFANIENAFIEISDYGDKSKKMGEIIKKCDEFNILYNVQLDEDWCMFGSHEYDRNYNEVELKHLYSVCESPVCISIVDGKIYNCPHITILNEEGYIPYCETDFCNVRDTPQGKLGGKIYDYIFNTPYLNGCKYCDGRHVYSKQVERGL